MNVSPEDQALIDEHNELLRKVCEQQKRTDAARFEITYNAATGFFDRDGNSYDEQIIKAMIRCYKSDLSGVRTGFACKPNPCVLK